MAPQEVSTEKQARGDHSAPARRKEGRIQRALIFLIFLIVLISLPLLAVRAEPPKPEKVVAADKFVLRDADGKVRLEMACTNGCPYVVLLDDRGQGRARLALAAEGSPSLALYDPQGNARAVIRLRPNGEPLVDVPAKAGREPARPAVAEADTAPKEPRPFASPLFGSHCQRCHAADGTGKRMRASLSQIPDFTRPAWQASRTDGQLLASILNGRGADMPPFADQLTPAQARDLVLVVRSFDPAGAKNRDPSAGGGDFDSQYQRLQRDWDELQTQLRALKAVGKP